jgi:hypothetical protein
VKAIASGNPAVLTLAEADAELQRLMILKKNHADEQYIARRSLRDLPESNGQLSKRLADFTADYSTMKAHADDAIIIGKQRCPHDKAAGTLGQLLESLPKQISAAQRFPLGVYRGLRFGLVIYPQFAPALYLEGATTRQTILSNEHHGPRAVLNALDRLAGGYGTECESVRQNLAIAESQLRDYQARLGKPFTLDAYLSELTALRDQLKAGLSGAAHQPDNKEGPSVSELADKIKSLKSAHSIEAAPQRARQKHSTAEEPITARIRRKTGAPPVSDSDHVKNPETNGSALAPASSTTPITFQERITRERGPAAEKPDFP